jgi:lipid A disaccharide synthetase
VVPELLQLSATSENIYEKMLPLLLNKESRDAMRSELFKVCKQLGEPGASRRVAKLASEMVAAV